MATRRVLVENPMMYILSPATAVTIASETGIPESTWQEQYRYDQAFGVVTKVIVVKVEDVRKGAQPDDSPTP